MDIPVSNPVLFPEFHAVSRIEWEAKINEDLKGADYAKKLLWDSPEGFIVRPYYLKDDLIGLGQTHSAPGQWPYIRGKRSDGNSWHIRQDLKAIDLVKANTTALDILMKGIDSLGFLLDENSEYSRNDIDTLLKNIHAHSVELNFLCGRAAHDIVGIILSLVKDYNRELDKITGSVDFDPLGHYMLKGKFFDTEEVSFRKCRELIELSDDLPNFRVIAVNGKQFREAGAGIVQELAFSLAVGNEYLSKITSAGLSVTRVAPRIKFNLGSGSDYFMEIAKFRAARLLWSGIVKAYGGDDTSCRMNIHATNVDWNKTVYDPYVNMLRTVTESMSAIIGGADSLEVQPYNAIYGDDSAFAQRIARNQQLLLREESYLDKVADPAGGAYYIETLTDQIAAKAWDYFRNIESNGGFLEAFKKGIIQQEIKSMLVQKETDLRTRKRTFLGTNQYPDINEVIKPGLPASLFETADLSEEGSEVETLPLYRGTQAFERMRYDTDLYSAAKGSRPKAFLFTYGNVGMRRARAMFATNFFGCAGFGIIDNNGFETTEEGIKAALEARADVVVICSSDEEYAPVASQILNALSAKAIIVVAGYPKDSLEALKSQGIEHFIHIRSNVYDELRMFQQKLGIISATPGN